MTCYFVESERKTSVGPRTNSFCAIWTRRVHKDIGLLSGPAPTDSVLFGRDTGNTFGKTSLGYIVLSYDFDGELFLLLFGDTLYVYFPFGMARRERLPSLVAGFRTF